MDLLFFIILNFFIVFINWYVSRALYKRSLNPLNIFTIIWVSSLMLCQLNMSDYYTISNVSYLIFYIPPFCFSLGTMFANLSRSRNFSISTIPIEGYGFNRYFQYASILIFIISISFGAFAYYTASRLGLDLKGFRTVIYDPNSGEISPILPRISAATWILKGVIFFLLFLSTYIVVFTRKMNVLKYVIANLLSLAIISLSTGGRMGFLYILYILICIFVIVSSIKHFIMSLKEIKKFKRIFRKAGIVTFSLIVLISLVRENDGSFLNILYNQFAKYYLGPFFGFDQMLSRGLIEQVQKEVPRVGVSFLGVDTVLVSGFMRFVFQLDIPSLLSQTSGIMHHGILIKSDLVMNAHYTSLYSMYIDGGVGYIALFFFIISFMMYKCTKAFGQRITFSIFVLLIVFLLFIVQSTRTNIFQEPSIVICLIITYFHKYFTRKSKYDFSYNN